MEGAPINSVYNVSKLGAEGYAISTVGKDNLEDDRMEESAK